MITVSALSTSSPRLLSPKTPIVSSLRSAIVAVKDLTVAVKKAISISFSAVMALQSESVAGSDDDEFFFFINNSVRAEA